MATGTISVNEDHDGNTITGLPTPAVDDEAATKKYVDDSVVVGGGVSSFNTRTGAVTAAHGDYSIEQLTEGSGSIFLWNHDIDGETSFTVSNTNVDTTPFAALKAGYGGLGEDYAWFIKYQDTYADPGGGRSGLSLSDNGDWAASLEIFSGQFGDLFLTVSDTRKIRFGLTPAIADMVVIDGGGLTVSHDGVINGIGSGLTGMTATQVGLDSVTNDAQTKAAIVPNTVPPPGEILVGKADALAYAPVAVSGSGATISLASTGVITISAIANASLSNSAITIAGSSTSLGGSITLDTITGLGSTGLVKRTGSNALGIASAGTDYVAPSGALGTPSSGTLTNCTGLPIAGLVASTSTAIGVGSIELGAASDTTIARSGAGAITVEGVQVILSGAALGTPSSGTLTNCTGLPVAGIAASTSTALGVGSIELGHATDTTLSRSSAGVLAIEGVKVLATNSTSGTQQGLIAVNSSSGAVVGTVARASGTSASGTPGTDVATITAGGGNQFICIHGTAGHTNTANTQLTVTITYSDATTTTDATSAGSAVTELINDAAINRAVNGAAATIVAHSSKKITAISITTLGTGVGTRAASLAAVEVPQ